MQYKRNSALQVEQHGMEQIPEDERHGKVASQFTLWFSSNVQINSFVTGTLAVVLGLNLFWAIAAIVVGNAVGGLFAAYHSVQGPRMGVPQMVQSRAQFGVIGAALPQAFTVVMYLGFYVVGGVLSGDAVGSLFHISTWIGVILWNIVILVVAIYGYDLVHASGRVATVISAILFLVLFIHLLGNVPSHYKGTAQSFATFMLVISVMAGWQITWAPYVSDYSRYLPVDTPARKTFLYTYSGLVGGAICVQIVGALAATTGAAELSTNVSSFVAHQFNGVYGIILLAILIGNIPATVESPYGGFLTFWAIVSPTGKGVPPRQARTLFAIAFTIVGSVLSIAASSSLLTTANDVIVFLLYVLIPWTAMNLVDYYFVRRGHYDVKELFNLDGIYGRFNWWALGIYIVTMAIEVPFMNTSVFTGPIAKSLNGADLTWIVGLVLASVSYYVIAKRVLPQTELPQVMAEPA
jgi:nucleobase:cation symporter-1, NCS1 family